MGMFTDELLRLLIEAEKTYRESLDLVQSQGAELFKSVRAEHHLTQRQLADALKVDFSFISKVENGHMRPGKPVLQRLAVYLADHQTDG
jgi:DNA-binding XRE family transcriptional regulator